MSDPRQFLIMMVCSAVLLTGCSTTRSPKAGLPAVAGDHINLTVYCQQHDMAWHWDPIAQVVTVMDKGRTINAMAGSDVVMVEQSKYILSEPARFEAGQIFVPLDFDAIIKEVEKTVKKTPASIAKQIKTIVIDAGHGGKDPGAIGHSGMYEKVVVLDLAKRLESLLKQRGYHVIMTRTTDVFLSLAERTQIASRHKADLFISIHANAHSRKSVNGMEVYVSKDLDYQDRREEQRLTNHGLFFKKLNMQHGDKKLEDVVSDMLYNYKKGVSRSLAHKVSEDTSQYVRARNLGQKDSRFFVLRNTLIPAILIEAGFMSNPREEKLLKSKEYRSKLARGIADSLEDFFNGR